MAKNKSSFNAAEGLFGQTPPAASPITAATAKHDTIHHISVDQLVWIEDQPFNRYSQEKFDAMVDSVRKNGVIEPITVRPYNGIYQVILGRHRCKASIAAELETVPCIVKQLTDDEAFVLMHDSDTIHRDTLLPSELAFASKKRLEIDNRQGQRSDLATSRHAVAKLDNDTSRHSVAKSPQQDIPRMSPSERRKAQRYARLTKLIKPLLDFVDEGQLSMKIADPLCDLLDNEQTILLETLSTNGCKITLEQATLLNELSKAGDLTADTFTLMFARQEKSPPAFTSYKLPKDFDHHFEGMSKKERDAKVAAILREYFRE